MEERMNIKTKSTKASKTASMLVLTTAAMLLAGCSGAPSNDDIKLAIAEKYSMSDVPKDLNCTLGTIDKTGQGDKRWNYTCDATYDYGRRKIRLGAWHQDDGKLAVFINN
jgi:hypothetical protein